MKTPKRIAEQDVIAWFSRFGVDLVASVGPAKDKGAAFDDCRRRVRERYHELAMTGHPDHGGDPEAWRDLTAVYNDICDLTLVPHEQTRRQPVGIRITVSTAGFGGTVTSTTGSGGWWPW